MAAKLRRYLPLYLMFLPGAIYLLINNYIPMAGIIVAFKKYNARLGIWKSPFCGLANFEFLFKSPDAWVITRNTILYNVVFIALNTVVGIMFAIFICDTVSKKLKKVYQSAILFPYLMSAVILGYIVYAFLSQSTGIVNNSILSVFGKEAVNWYAEPKYWPFILVFVNLWKGVGYGCLIYISTIIGRIFYSDFGLFFQVPRDSGLLYSTTNVIDTYVYRGLMKSGNVGMSAAAGFYQSIIGFIIVLTANAVVRKVSEENAMF